MKLNYACTLYSKNETGRKYMASTLNPTKMWGKISVSRKGGKVAISKNMIVNIMVLEDN